MLSLKLVSARVLAFAVLALCASSGSAQVVPHRSFSRLVTGNGHMMASYDRESRRVDTFLEHAYRFASPRPSADLCFGADETRDLAFDSYFGVRVGGAGSWLTDAPLDDAGYEVGTNIIHTLAHVGPSRGLAVRTYTFAPTGVEEAALVRVIEVENVSSSPLDVSLYSLFNFHLGLASGGREPSANGEQASFDAARSSLYEYGPSQGTLAYTALSTLGHRTVSTGAASAFNRLGAGAHLDDVSATTGPTSDVAPGLESTNSTLAPGARAAFAVAIVWALDEDAAPHVDAVRAHFAGLTPMQIVQAERDAWTAWQTTPPAGLSADERDLWLQSNVILRMGQVREAGTGFGQILASLPPGLGFVDAQWNISWVRDMAYAVAGLSRAGHLAEAEAALRFQLGAGPGRHTAEVGMPYRISVTRYFGNGEEESDCNADGPNVEFDGFGLFLWSVGEFLRAGADVETLRADYPVIRDEIADVLISLIDDDGLVKADSSIWEVHWNGKQRRFTYTSLAAARGLCDAAALATALGEDADAARFSAAGARVRDAIIVHDTDARGALGQSAEDVARGFGYVDASSVEAIDWGIVDPAGRTARQTVIAMLDNLTVASGIGLMRNDDGGWYDSQEWVFVDMRLLPALYATGGDARADRLTTWLEQQALANDLHFSELHDAVTGDYAGSIPMVGFGAGAYLLAKGGAPLAAACGAYAAEPTPPPMDAGVDAGASDAGASDAGVGDAGAGDAATSDSSSPDTDAGRVDGGYCFGASCDDGGCSCSLARSRGAPLGVSWLLVALGAAWTIRRRR
ncbi:MAG: hypothetical protein GXP55_25335 [Deltaproteobacteria bacterium]|nr:hypothetical protein [Deltaproteobacteria bacterium]